jgi:hypothetical protein
MKLNVEQARRGRQTHPLFQEEACAFKLRAQP